MSNTNCCTFIRGGFTRGGCVCKQDTVNDIEGKTLTLTEVHPTPLSDLPKSPQSRERNVPNKIKPPCRSSVFHGQPGHTGPTKNGWFFMAYRYCGRVTHDEFWTVRTSQRVEGIEFTTSPGNRSRIGPILPLNDVPRSGCLQGETTGESTKDWTPD